MRLAIATVVAVVMLVFIGCGSRTSRDRDRRGVASEWSEQTLHPTLSFEAIEDALPGSEFLDGSETGSFALPETTGGGSAALDFDSDGRLDLCCSAGGAIDVENRRSSGRAGTLFRGLGRFRFHSIATSARIDLSRVYNGAIVASDFDSDGFTDLAVAGFSNFLLFRNMGDGTFESLPDLAGEVGRWSSHAAFFDADGDGDLDLYVVHYADWSFDKSPFCPSRMDAQERDYCGPTDFGGLQDSFYLNQGDGSWIDASGTMTAGFSHRGLGVIAADIDGDGDTDVYVCNDVEPNLFFLNETSKGVGELSWREIGVPSGTATDPYGKPEGSMGISLGDYNNDGKFDLWVTNYQDEVNALYRNSGNSNFMYASNASRIAPTDEQTVGWGTAFLDADLDGDEDLLVINGHLEKYAQYRLQRPQLLENIDGRRFELTQGCGAFFETAQAGRGLSIADFDADGRLDGCVTRVGSNHAVIRNTSPTSGGYLRVQLIGRDSNREAIGAIAVLRIQDLTLARQVYSGGSYASTSERTLHFGIPDKFARAEGNLSIRWPSGLRQEITLSAWNQTLQVVETHEWKP